MQHKKECIGIANIHPNSPSDTMRLVIKVLLQKEEGARKVCVNYSISTQE